MSVETGREPRVAATYDATHWDALAGDWGRRRPQTLWRTFCDLAHTALIERWLPEQRVGRVLKTDLFDEVLTDGLYPVLSRKAGEVMGMDVAASAAAQATVRHPRLSALSADARRLPFADGSFDAIVSNSTLDHFETLTDVAVSLRELARITRPGGTLILTLDNLANPVVALRSVLPFAPLRRLGLVPYYVGATCGPKRLQSMVVEAGFTVACVEQIMHCPRLLAVALTRVVERHGSPEAQRRLLRHLAWYERLQRWPTREWTSYFTAIRAVRNTG